jgi:cytochrome c oxidase subunit 2
VPLPCPRNVVLPSGALALVMGTAGCGGAASALNPAGSPADDIAGLFWWMTAGATVVWLSVLAIAIVAARAEPNGDREAQAKRLIIAGAAVPTVVLTGLLAYGLTMLPRALAPAAEDTLRVWVHGEQWWWRIHYQPAAGPPFVLANEIRLPVGRPVEFLLESDNVIHSFWVPALGGKMDLIPGRTNRLLLRPTKVGTFDGMCAEFCGRAHAKMRLAVVVLPVDEFENWAALQARPAASNNP